MQPLSAKFVPTVKLSVMSSASNKDPLTLYCDVGRFYPETVSVSWFQNGTALPNPPAVDQNPDGTYKTRHFFTLSPEQRQQRGPVKCAVTLPGVENSTSFKCS
uniref:Ig-like domain-containing protein n=1 Tax=Oryzias latipes TaxID=8090 RepID=A0A3P9L1I6_ORYLA